MIKWYLFLEIFFSATCIIASIMALYLGGSVVRERFNSRRTKSKSYTMPPFILNQTEERNTMDGLEFISRAINLVKDDYDATQPIAMGDALRYEEIYVVWSTKVLNNNKGLFATERNDGLYYEITHNGTTGECYVDRYKKESNYAVKVVDPLKGNPNRDRKTYNEMMQGIAIPSGHINHIELAQNIAKEIKLMNSDMSKTTDFNSNK